MLETTNIHPDGLVENWYCNSTLTHTHRLNLLYRIDVQNYLDELAWIRVCIVQRQIWNHRSHSIPWSPLKRLYYQPTFSKMRSDRAAKWPNDWNGKWFLITIRRSPKWKSLFYQSIHSSFCSRNNYKQHGRRPTHTSDFYFKSELMTIYIHTNGAHKHKYTASNLWIQLNLTDIVHYNSRIAD